MIAGAPFNIAANIFGRVWAAGLQFLLVPVYLRLLGPEAYGLMAFYVTLVTLAMFIDHSVSPVITREFARLSHEADGVWRMRTLLRSLETVSWTFGVVAGVAIVLLASPIARHAIHSSGLAQGEVTWAIALMGVSLATQVPGYLYVGGFIGLHRQDQVTLVRVVSNSVQWFGGLLVLILVAPRIEYLLGWQAASFALQSGMLRFRLWRLLPEVAAPARFDATVLRDVAGYAIGTLGIGLTGGALMQVDKLFVVKYAPLADFSAYTLAFAAAGLLTIFVGLPIATVVVPRFTRLVTARDEVRLADEYHGWSQAVALFAFPAAAALIVFARPLVSLWLGAASALIDPVVRLLPYVAIGQALFAVFFIPTGLLAAAGRTRLLFSANLAALAVDVIALWLAMPYLGMIAGARCWLGLNLYYCLVCVPLIHRRILPGELLRWWGDDTILPAGCTAIIFVASWALVPSEQGRWAGAMQALATAAIAVLALVFALPHPRRWATAFRTRILEAIR